jgi:hypothetical protein
MYHAASTPLRTTKRRTNNPKSPSRPTKLPKSKSRASVGFQRQSPAQYTDRQVSPSKTSGSLRRRGRGATADSADCAAADVAGPTTSSASKTRTSGMRLVDLRSSGMPAASTQPTGRRAPTGEDHLGRTPFDVISCDGESAPASGVSCDPTCDDPCLSSSHPQHILRTAMVKMRLREFANVADNLSR